MSQITYTVMTVAAHLVGELGDLHALTLDQRQQLTDDQAAPLILGTQWFCTGVATYVTFIWILKLNMLFLYQRVVHGLWVAKFIKPTMGLVIVTYISIMLILFCSCRPYHRMWIVYPDQGGEFSHTPLRASRRSANLHPPQNSASHKPTSTSSPPWS